MILYWTPLSSYSAKVRLACALKRLMPELRLPPDGSYRSDGYRAMPGPYRLLGRTNNMKGSRGRGACPVS